MQEHIDKIYSIKTFGVEIECYVPSQGWTEHDVLQDIADRLTECGIKTFVKLYTHKFNLNEWKIVPDGSLREGCPSGHYPLELVSPPLTEEDGYRQIEIVCRVLNECGAKVNKCCGLHIHVGYHKPACNRVGAVRQLLNFYGLNENYFDLIQPQSRRNNRFCQSIVRNSDYLQYDFERNYTSKQKTISSIFQNYFNGNRYMKINLGAYVKYGTIEFRQHSGTVESSKIINWIKICRALCEKSRREINRKNLKKAESFEEFFNEIKPYADDSAINYLKERYNKFTEDLPY